MIKGLYIDQANDEAHCTRLSNEIAAGDLLPADEHAKREQLAAILRGRVARDRHIQANETDHEVIEKIIEANAHLLTRDRSIVRMLLEQASDRLRRELGDQPETI